MAINARGKTQLLWYGEKKQMQIFRLKWTIEHWACKAGFKNTKMILSCIIRNDIFKFHFWSSKFKRMGRNLSLKPIETRWCRKRMGYRNRLKRWKGREHQETYIQSGFRFPLNPSSPKMFPNWEIWSKSWWQ